MMADVLFEFGPQTIETKFSKDPNSNTGMALIKFSSAFDTFAMASDFDGYDLNGSMLRVQWLTPDEVETLHRHFSHLKRVMYNHGIAPRTVVLSNLSSTTSVEQVQVVLVVEFRQEVRVQPR